MQTLKVQSSLQSTMPADFSSLSPWITGTGAYAPKGHIVMQMYFVGPWNGTIDSLTVDGTQASVSANQLGGRQVAFVPIDLVPGQLTTLTAIMHTGPGQTGAGKLTWTPGMGLDVDPAKFASAC